MTYCPTLGQLHNVDQLYPKCKSHLPKYYFALSVLYAIIEQLSHNRTFIQVKNSGYISVCFHNSSVTVKMALVFSNCTKLYR